MDAPALGRLDLEMPMSAPTTVRRICPKCLSNRVHWSRSKGVERMVRFAGVGFYRCRHCKYRFLGYRGWGKRQTRIFIIIIGFFVLLLLLWLGIQWMSPSALPR